MLTHTIPYIIACIVFPVLWGLIVYWISNKIEQKVQRSESSSTPTPNSADILPLDYHI